MLGYSFAVVSSLFYSFYVIPRKLSKLNPLEFSFLMALGFSVSSALLYLTQLLLGLDEQVSPVLLLSVLAGAIWAVSFVTFVKAIDSIGLSRSNQWKNLQGPFAAVLGLIVLAEYKSTRPLFVILAGLSVFISAICFTISSSRSEQKRHQAGTLLATSAGLGFGTVAVIQKYVTSQTGIYTQQVVWSISIALSITIYTFFVTQKLPRVRLGTPDTRLAIFAGLLYLGASYFQLRSYSYLPASIAFTLIQLNTIWTITIGILFFKEIPIRPHYKRLLAGILFALIGILLLAAAKK